MNKHIDQTCKDVARDEHDAGSRMKQILLEHLGAVKKAGEDIFQSLRSSLDRAIRSTAPARPAVDEPSPSRRDGSKRSNAPSARALKRKRSSIEDDIVSASE